MHALPAPIQSLLSSRAASCCLRLDVACPLPQQQCHIGSAHRDLVARQESSGYEHIHMFGALLRLLIYPKGCYSPSASFRNTPALEEQNRWQAGRSDCQPGYMLYWQATIRLAKGHISLQKFRVRCSAVPAKYDHQREGGRHADAVSIAHHK
ncbi:hypothetical protein GQ54DRAFT_306211 [Martensiomyces pterosporus]|nr:hypothetical protein GQ54DRAFT_306211 [Martensiomyces pterosporus]